jgi:hypothetical protein
MSDIKKAVLKVAKANPEFRKALQAELKKTAGGTGWPLTPRPVVVGPRRIKKTIIDSGEFTREYLESLDFNKVEYDKPEKNTFRINGTLVTWRVFPKGSFGDRDSNYVYGYVSTEWKVGSKGIVMEGNVVVKH